MSRRESRSQIRGRQATPNTRFRTSISAFGSARTPTSTHSACFRREVPPTLPRHPRRRPPQSRRLLRRLCVHRQLRSRRRLPLLPSRLHPRPSRQLLRSHSRSRYLPRRWSTLRLVQRRCRERRPLRLSLAERPPRRWHGALGPSECQSTRRCRPEVRKRPRERTCAGHAPQLRRAAMTAESPRGRLSASLSTERLLRPSACPISCGATRPCSSMPTPMAATSRLGRGSLTPRRFG